MSSHERLIEAVRIYQDALERAAETSQCKMCGYAETVRVRDALYHLQLAAQNFDREKVPA